MATCPDCGAAVHEDAVHCGNCNAAISSPAKSTSTSPPQVTSQGSSASPNAPSVNIYVRLEKAMRRAELLSYAAAGLGLTILAVIILIAFL